MIDIVELKPELSDTILNEGLEKLAVLEDRKIYYHFRDNVFYKELDNFILGKDPKTASKIKDITYVPTGEKSKINHENNSLRLRFIDKFELVRNHYFLFNDKIHTYSINSLESPTNVITVHQWENNELIGNLETLAKLRKKGLFKVLYGNFK